MDTKKFDYRIYPTLLDAYNYYKAPVMYMREDESEEDIESVRFKDLIDKINRVPYVTTEAQQKGIDFENVINEMIDGNKVEHSFNPDIVNRIYNEVKTCNTKQQRMSADIQTSKGLVELYGVLDYTFGGYQVDLKTTKRYEFLKYKDNTQHKIYPLIARYNFIIVNDFHYLVTDFKDVFLETYTWNSNLENEVVANVCDFIDFLEINRHLITDKKIFGGEN